MAGYGGEDFRKVAGIGSITRPNPDGGGGGGYHRDRRNKKVRIRRDLPASSMTKGHPSRK